MQMMMQQQYNVNFHFSFFFPRSLSLSLCLFASVMCPVVLVCSVNTKLNSPVSFRVQQVTHWQHPRFHAYFPSGNSFPSILGDMLSDGIGAIGFSWVSAIHVVICQLLFLSRSQGDTHQIPHHHFSQPPSAVKSATTKQHPGS